MPRSPADGETLVSDEEMRDADAFELRSAARGSFLDPYTSERRWRVPKAIAEAVLEGRRLVPGDFPGAMGPKGVTARQSGAWAGWSTEIIRGVRRRFTVLRLAVEDWTVVDIDRQDFTLVNVPGNLAGIVETERGVGLILRGGYEQNKDMDFLRKLPRDENYLRISLKRGTFNMRATSKKADGVGRVLHIVSPKKSASAKLDEDLRNLSVAWQGSGGRVTKR